MGDTKLTDHDDMVVQLSFILPQPVLRPYPSWPNVSSSQIWQSRSVHMPSSTLRLMDKVAVTFHLSFHTLDKKLEEISMYPIYREL